MHICALNIKEFFFFAPPGTSFYPFGVILSLWKMHTIREREIKQIRKIIVMNKMKGIKGTKNWGVLHWILTPSCLPWLKEWKQISYSLSLFFFLLYLSWTGNEGLSHYPCVSRGYGCSKLRFHFPWSLVFKSPIRNWKGKRKTEYNPQCTDNFSLPLFQIDSR